MRTNIASRAFPLIGLLFGAQSSALSAASRLKQDEKFDSGRQAYEASDYTQGRAALAGSGGEESPECRNPAVARQDLLRNAISTMPRSPARKRRSRSTRKIRSITNGLAGRTATRPSTPACFPECRSQRRHARNSRRPCDLDEKNFSARQALIEFDCSAPGIVGGGEDKALPQIAKLAELDASEGHYAAGNCRRQKKDFAAADAEFAKALESHPKSANLIYDIGDYAMKHSQPERLLAVASEGEKVAPTDASGEILSCRGSRSNK